MCIRDSFSLAINSLTSSYLSAARCHEALEASPACLRPLSHLQYTGEPLIHAPIPSATRLTSLWRHLAIETRGVADPELSPPPSTTPTLPHHHRQRHTSTTSPGHSSTHIHAPQRCSMQPINQPIMPACTVSAAVTPGLTLTRSRCPPTSVLSLIHI